MNFITENFAFGQAGYILCFCFLLAYLAIYVLESEEKNVPMLVAYRAGVKRFGTSTTGYICMWVCLAIIVAVLGIPYLNALTALIGVVKAINLVIKSFNYWKNT